MTQTEIEFQRLLIEIRDTTSRTSEMVRAHQAELSLLQRTVVGNRLDAERDNEAVAHAVNELGKRVTALEFWKTALGYVGVGIGGILSYLGVDFAKWVWHWFTHRVGSADGK